MFYKLNFDVDSFFSLFLGTCFSIPVSFSFHPIYSVGYLFVAGVSIMYYNSFILDGGLYRLAFIMVFSGGVLSFFFFAVTLNKRSGSSHLAPRGGPFYLVSAPFFFYFYYFGYFFDCERDNIDNYIYRAFFFYRASFFFLVMIPNSYVYFMIIVRTNYGLSMSFNGGDDCEFMDD